MPLCSTSPRSSEPSSSLGRLARRNTLRRPRRGLKTHAVLHQVCTNGQHLSPHKRGRCCPFFCWPPGACTRVSAAHSPHWEGGNAVNFFFGPLGPNRRNCNIPPYGGRGAVFSLSAHWAQTIATVTSLHMEGGVLSFLFRPTGPKSV